MDQRIAAEEGLAPTDPWSHGPEDDISRLRFRVGGDPAINRREQKRMLRAPACGAFAAELPNSSDFQRLQVQIRRRLPAGARFDCPSNPRRNGEWIGNRAIMRDLAAKRSLHENPRSSKGGR